MPDYNIALVAGAALSAIASLLHLAIIFGGAPWYRFFGAGERFAAAAEQGHWWQHGVTFGIALVLATWAAYALSGAGLLAPLPWLKPALGLITAVYLLRGLAMVPALLLGSRYGTQFVVWSSLICLAFGLVHLWGLVQIWPNL
jgi:hypothetical protein